MWKILQLEGYLFLAGKGRMWEYSLKYPQCDVQHIIPPFVERTNPIVIYMLKSVNSQKQTKEHIVMCYGKMTPQVSKFSKRARCWLNQASCYDKKQCIETRKDGKRNLLFCCCDGDMCNEAMYHNPAPIEITPPSPVDEKRVKMNDNEEELLKTLLCTLVPLTVLTIMIILLFWIYRKRRMSDFNEVPTVDPTTPLPPTPLLTAHPVQLIEIKARGRFGAVWKAQISSTEYVAVKVFPLQDKASFMVEQEVYQLPQMKHENVLNFIGTQRRGESLQTEYWLITSYHDKGSLYDYLKANLLSWKDLCKIAESMTKGLMHLHEELPASKGENYKPSLAHRDFKSKNVLLKADNTACVADLGLGVIFRSGESTSEAHGQVGTRRYMAPEVLEGAINFHRDSFLRIDMYACGLVLWELVTRCSIQDGPVGEYMLPFEEEVGQHPTLEDMQEAVVEKKCRPKLKDSWRNNMLLSMICESIEECWDHDAEARLSASCIQERMAALPRTAVINISNHSNTGII
ncbi:Activin receptor type-2B [Nymphon striatum]|nr:Activin receptor type-2B [Nymphon striatum]